MKLRLVYPNFPFWRAEVSRIALHLGQIDFEDHHPSREEFQQMKRDGVLPFGQVPVLIVDGEIIAQTGAIARFCGKLSGLYPTTDHLAAAKIDQYIDAATDITNQVSPTMRIKDEAAKLEARAALATQGLPKSLANLERLAKQSTSGFLVGDSLTIADVAIWRLLGWLKGGILDGIPTDILTPFEALERHQEHIGSQAEISAWMAKYG